MKESELVRQASRGDTEAFGQLVGAYQGMVFAVALNITGNYADSEDVVQDSFLRAWTRLHTLADPAKFGSWLYMVARRAALQFVRDHRKVRVHNLEEELEATLESDRESPAEAFARKELSELLWAEVAELPSRSREAVLLFYVEGFSLRRAAEFLGINENAFKARLHFAREKLRDALQHRLGEEVQRRQPGDARRRAILAALPPIAGFHPSPSTDTAGPAARGAPPRAQGTGSNATVSRPVAPSTPSLPSSPPHITYLVYAVVCVALLTGGLALVKQMAPSRGSAPPPSPLFDDSAAQSVSPERNGSGSAADPAVSSEPPAPGPRKITGRVLDREQRQPIPGVKVELLQNGKWIRRTETGTDGQYQILGIYDGTYDLDFKPASPAMRDVFVFLPHESEFRVHLQGTDAMGVELTLPPAFCFTGRVLGPEDKPVPGAAVSVRGEMAKQFGGRLETTTHSDGSYTLAGLRKWEGGNFALTAAAPGYLETALVELPPPPRLTFRELKLDIRLRPVAEGVSIAGRVTLEQGRPVDGVCVEVSFPGGHRRQMTGREGRYRFEALPPGDLSVSTLPAGTPAGAQGPGRNDISLTAQPGETIAAVDFTLQTIHGTGTLRGTLRDDAGQPVAGILLYATEDPDEGERIWLAAAITDQNGIFQFRNLPTERPLDLMTEDWQKGRAVLPRNAQAPATGIELRYEPGRPASSLVVTEIRGRVVDATTNNPIKQFLCYSGMQFEPRFREDSRPQIFANPDGRFVFREFLGARTQANDGATWVSGTFHVEAPGYAVRDTNIRVPDSPGYVDEELALNRGATAAGQVVDSAGNPVEGAWVFTMRASIQFHGVSGPGGAFGLQGISGSEGKETIWAYHPDFAQGSVELHNLAEGELRDKLQIVLAPGASLSGHVTDSAGKPIANARVEFDSYLGKTDYQAQTDSLGYYRIDRVIPGLYKGNVKDISDSRKTIEVAQGEAATLDFGSAETTITGRVTVDGAPLSGGRVQLDSGEESTWDSAVSAQTDVDKSGMYQLRGIPKGSHRVVVRNEHRREIHAQSIDVTAGRDMRCDINIRTAGIRGWVTVPPGTDESIGRKIRIDLYEPGQLLPGSDDVIRNRNSSGLYTTRLASDYTFACQRVPPGDYVVHAEAWELGHVWQPVHLEPGQTLEDLALEFPTPGILKLALLDRGPETPLEGRGIVNLFLEDEQGRFYEEDYFPAGETLANNRPSDQLALAPGNYRCFAYAKFRDPEQPFVTPATSSFEIRPGTTTVTDLILFPAREIRIDLKWDDGRRLRDFRADVLGVDGTRIPFALVNASGIDGFAPLGPIRVAVFRGDTVLDEQTFILESGTRAFTSEFRLREHQSEALPENAGPPAENHATGE